MGTFLLNFQEDIIIGAQHACHGRATGLTVRSGSS